jgi:hypothetical protein
MVQSHKFFRAPCYDHLLSCLSRTVAVTSLKRAFEVIAGSLKKEVKELHRLIFGGVVTGGFLSVKI